MKPSAGFVSHWLCCGNHLRQHVKAADREGMVLHAICVDDVPRHTCHGKEMKCETVMIESQSGL